jgi:hypothetical protein
MSLHETLTRDVRATFARQLSPTEMQAAEPMIQKAVTAALADKELVEWSRQQVVAQQRAKDAQSAADWQSTQKAKANATKATWTHQTQLANAHKATMVECERADAAEGLVRKMTNDITSMMTARRTGGH